MPKTRTLGELATSQCGFIAFIAKPVLKLWDGIFGREAHVRTLTSHLAFWKALGEAARRDTKSRAARRATLVDAGHPRCTGNNEGAAVTEFDPSKPLTVDLIDLVPEFRLPTTTSGSVTMRSPKSDE